MGVGRFACVALPAALTVASLICIMIAMLAGITTKNLDMFEIETKNLSVTASTLLNVANLTNTGGPGLGKHIGQALAPNAGNITAANLELADSYRVSLWNYCSTNGTTVHCTKGKFDWATSATNVTAMKELVGRLTNYNNATLPKELDTALKTFQHVHKWTQVVYIISILTAVSTLFLGIFAIFSRGASCVTYIVSGLATTSIMIASIMATIESTVIVTAIKAVEKSYNVKAHLNTSFLSVTWLAVAFSLGAGLFWLFSVCCCAANHHSKSGRKSGDQEKFLPTGAYQRVDDPTHYSGAGGVPMKPMQRGNGAYEPYSHGAV